MDSNCFQSSPSSRRICKYDVFLSFKGDDTRNTFIDHLYSHLTRKGVFTFKDDKRLEKGQPISSQLLQAIRGSRVSIVIFSRDYASSTWCLEEMAAVVDCREELKQVVFPVFYDMDPSHVRKQNGAYEAAFVLHTERFKQDPGKVDRWKRAMTGLANLAGWDVRYKPEFGEIEKIVQKVIKILNHKFSRFADDLIGIQPRVEGLEKLLKLSSSKDDDFRVLGIWGMGGIGKTTHATVLYDRISYQFDACCFIENVSKIYKDGGATAVQKQILRQTLDEKNLDTYSPSEISGIITNRLHNIKVLVVLDNVDQLEQLQELVINPKLLSAESRVIITSRDEHILKVYGADEVHNVPLLSNDDARELFSRKAFKRVCPSNNCEELIPEVLKYAQSLPLTISVMGSFLCTRDATQWRDALDRLENNPENKIMDVLRISFEGLQLEEKEIFLHIACFFRGEREDYVKRILHGCGLHPNIGIPVIKEKSLIIIRNQEIHMHEILHELGKKIVRERYPEEPGLWSRIWRYNDFHHVLMSKRGANNIKAIVLEHKEDVDKCRDLRVEGLSKMRGLRLLILYQKNFSGSLNFLSNSLQYLLWHGYPFSSLPLNFEPYSSLVELNLPCSNIKQLWEGRKNFLCLRRVDLSNSKELIETPNFEWCPSLKRLDLTGCTNLLQVHPSIGLLKQLAYLSLRDCSSLVSLNLSNECKLSSLRVLHLSGCTKLKNTPDFTGLLNLEYLDLEQCTSLATLHESIGALAKLRFLSLRGCKNLVMQPNNISFMTSLQTLDLRGCSKLQLQLVKSAGGGKSKKARLEFPKILNTFMSCSDSLIFLDLSFCNLSEVPDAIAELRCLERLNLQGNKIRYLGAIKRLSNLAYLNLGHCYELSSLGQFPFDSGSSGGRYFKTVSGSRNHRSGLCIFYCPMLRCWFPQNLALLWLIRLVEQPCHFRCGFDIVIPETGITIPWWYFNHRFDGGSIIRIADSNMDANCAGFAFCVVFEVSNPSTLLPGPLYLSFESEQAEESFHIPFSLEQHKDERLRLFNMRHHSSKHVWIIYISRPHCHFVKTGACITFKAHPGYKVHKWGLRMVFKQDIEAMKRKLRSSRTQGVGPHFYCFADEDESSGPKIQLLDYRLVIEDVHESSSSTGPKIQLPYNWFVTDDEENENMEAKAKEINLSNMGL